RHPAHAEAGAGHRGAVLDDLHLQRLQHRLRAHPWRPHQLDAPVRHAGPPDRIRDRTHRRRRGDLALPLPHAGVRGVDAVAVHPAASLLMGGFGRRRLGWKVATHLLLLPFLVFALFPFYHMLLTSLKQNSELYDRQAAPLIIRQGATLEHYTKLLWETAFLTWTKNSFLVTTLATALSVVIGTVA